MEELNRLIEEAVCSLPDKCGQVYRKSREEGKTNQEIAGEMGISVKTVEAQITKALKHIKKFFRRTVYLFVLKIEIAGHLSFRMMKGGWPTI